MRKLAFFAPLAATLAVAAAAQAQPDAVTVHIGPDLQEKADDLGQREVDQQAARLADKVREVLARRGALNGARIDLVLTDLQPNRPTWQQASDRPGLSIMDSFSIGGATIEGEVVTADGQRLPIRFSRYSNDIRNVQGYGTWWDADRAFERLANNLAEGRLVSR